MAKKVVKNVHNPLLIPLIIAVVLAAFFGGLSLNRGFNNQFEGTKIEFNISPTPTILPTDIPNNTYNETSSKEVRKSFSIPLSNKIIYCVTSQYDAINSLGSQILTIYNTSDKLGAEGQTCIDTRCRDKSDEIKSQCYDNQNVTDIEGCIKDKVNQCANGCMSAYNSYKQNSEQQFNDLKTKLNSMIGQYCYNNP